MLTLCESLGAEMDRVLVLPDVELERAISRNPRIALMRIEEQPPRIIGEKLGSAAQVTLDPRWRIPPRFRRARASNALVGLPAGASGGAA
jgi:hypothetical protein